MFYQQLIDKVMSLGQGLVISSAFVLSPANFTSASITPSAIQQFETDSSSASQDTEARDYSQDLQRAMRELEIARELLAQLGAEIDGAVVDFVKRLGGILDSAISVNPTELPRYSRLLADLLQAARGHLLDGVERVSTWTRLARLVNPATSLVLPERFLARRPAKALDLSQADLQIAAYLRSERGPQIA